MKRKHRINDEITALKLRVLDQEGEMIGVLSLAEAKQKARDAEVDLVEVSPKADPPVARIIDYGKMLYAEQKREQAQKKAQKKLEIKGIRLTFRMADADRNRQLKHAEEFLEEGHTVRVQLKMRGREKAHKDMALEKLLDFANDLSEIASLENTPKAAGHQIIAVLKPTQKKK